MAAFGGHDAVNGNQILVVMRRGAAFPPRSCSIRLRYEQTVADLKAAIEKELGIPPAQQQLFLAGRKQELSAQDEATSLLQLNMHTGAGVRGYDLREPPVYWPPVKQAPDGSMVEVGPGDDDEAAE